MVSHVGCAIDVESMIAGAGVYFWVATGGQRCVCDIFWQRLPGARPDSSVSRRRTCMSAASAGHMRCVWHRFPASACTSRPCCVSCSSARSCACPLASAPTAMLTSSAPGRCADPQCAGSDTYSTVPAGKLQGDPQPGHRAECTTTNYGLPPCCSRGRTGSIEDIDRPMWAAIHGMNLVAVIYCVQCSSERTELCR